MSRLSHLYVICFNIINISIVFLFSFTLQKPSSLKMSTSMISNIKLFLILPYFNYGCTRLCFCLYAGILQHSADQWHNLHSRYAELFLLND